MSSCPLLRPNFRYLAFIVFTLFFINIILLTHIADLHLYVQQIFKNVQTTASLSNSEDTTQSVDASDECVISENLALSALSRMNTEACRREAKQLICAINKTTSQTLPNTCPRYDDVQRGSYVGCYVDKKSARVLTGHTYRFKQNNSPQYCVNQCLRAGYLYAGVEFKEECFCGDSLKYETKTLVENCERFECPNNAAANKCGGYEALSVYRTGLTDKSIRLVSYMETNLTENSDVQILFLLQLNGRNVRQIIRMLNVIYSPKHLYIVHVDSRQWFMHYEMKKFADRAKANGLKNIHVIEKRHATIWGAASLLLMYLDAVKCALEEMGWLNWDFILNLSETDFPLLSLQELEYHLARNKGYNFLSSHGYDTARFIQKQGLEYVFFECESRMWRLGKRSVFPDSIRFDGGSDWLVLSRDFAQFALTNDALVRSLREMFANILLPVESFFHTLSANSVYCNRTIKGNLRLTNWKRKQGCRCAMLKKVVDWCGCSPLVFAAMDTSKYAVETAKKKAVFFGRKFDSFISQSAIAQAESQAFRNMAPNFVNRRHVSFERVWINFYNRIADKSLLLHAWAETIFSLKSHETAASMGGCEFVDLIELHLYKESDDGEVRTIVDCEVLCGSADEQSSVVIEMLVSPKSDIVLLNNDAIVDGYRLVDLKVGTDLELKQEVYRNYASVFSQDDAITAKLSWQRVEDQPTTVSANFSSPFVDAEWTDPLGRLVKASTVPSYDSIYGSQIVTLLANETLAPSIGEWQLNIWAVGALGGPPASAGTSHKAKTARTHLASVNFATFPSDGRDLNKSLIRKYFTVMDACIVNTTAKADGVLLNSSANCSQTLWSHRSPDPKSEFNFYRFLADKTDR